MSKHFTCDRLDNTGHRCNLPATWRFVYELSYPSGSLRARYRCDDHFFDEMGWHADPIGERP